MTPTPIPDTQPPTRGLLDFDPRSGSAAERLFFNHRPWVLVLCLLATLLLGWQALGLKLNASYEKTIPTRHPYIANYLENKANLAGQGNALRIAVAVKQGTAGPPQGSLTPSGGGRGEARPTGPIERSILDKDYLDTLRQLNDEIFLLPGVDRPFMKSLWTSNMRWVAVSEEGLDGGTVMGERYDGSPGAMAEVRANIERSGEIGQLVAADFKSSIIYVPLLDKDPRTGAALDYAELSQRIEALRDRFQGEGIRIHVIGFAKVVGDLMEGLRQMLGFFALALLITAGVLYGYTRCVRSTAIVVACSLVAVVWQFGLLRVLHFELDPYSVLVPFLVFAIGMSHGAQKMNGILQDVGRGTHRVVAARCTFRRLFAAGLTALLCDAVGFAVLALIEIRVIQDLAVIASIGVAVLVFTNLVLLPVLLSYTGVSPKAARRSLVQERRLAPGRRWALLGAFTRTWPALGAIGIAVLLAVAGGVYSLQLRIGDLDPGAPELRADSRYNRDHAYIEQHYAASTDILTVMVKTPEDQCTRYATLSQVDDLAWQLQQLPGVKGAQSMAGLSRLAMVGYNEGNLKWYELIPNDKALGGVQAQAPRELFNQGCSFLSLYVYLQNHKAETLERVVAAVEDFIARQPQSNVRFMLAAGSAGIDAATNIVVKQALREMLLWVYGAVLLLCWLTFRSWRATLVAVLPLVLTSILCEALMVLLGMGVKVATLPVVALGVGIGVDYALYVLAVMLSRLRAGESLEDAYRQALQFTGRVVMLTGLTLALAVGTWVFSPIKFQADMGLLLAFMFVWNMVGALVLLPALARWLLAGPKLPTLRPLPRPAAALTSRMRGIAAGLLALPLAALYCDSAQAQIVLGQSLPMSGPAFPIANRVLAGAKTLVESVNAAGGVNGKLLELVTLDDGGDPRRTAENVRQLVRKHGVAAILNCVGEQACLSAAAATSKLGVPLVGPLSGAAALRTPAWPHVFSLRVDDRREAQALMSQLKAIGSARVIVLGDGEEPERERVVADVLQAGGMAVQWLRPEPGPGSIESAMRQAVAAAPDVLVLNLGAASLDTLGRVDAALFKGLPGLVASLSNPGLTQLTRLLRSHTLGFTSSVPIPEISQLPLVYEFERDSDTFGSPEGLTFEGLAGYMHLRLCVEALRRAGPRPAQGSLARAIEALGEFSLGGFRVRFGPMQHHGSGFVELGLRTRDGRLRR